MASIAVPKTWLCLTLLSVISFNSVSAAETARGYRFGEWTIVLPAQWDAAALEGSQQAPQRSSAGLEILAYWQDGSDRAVALRFHPLDSQQDTVVLRSFGRSQRLKACGFGASQRFKSLQQTGVASETVEALPSTAAITLPGSDRGVRTAGDLFIADLGPARVQLAQDSPTVRVGAWNSADYCRFELNTRSVEADD